LEKAAEHFEQGVSLALHKTKVNLGIAAVLNVGLCVGLILYSFYV
jgi:hypothetical protein